MRFILGVVFNYAIINVLPVRVICGYIYIDVSASPIGTTIEPNISATR